MEEDTSNVRRLGGNWPQLQPCNAPGVKVHSDRELDLDPLQGDWLHRENIERVRIHHDVLPRPHRLQTSEHAGGPLRHRSAVLGAVKRVAALVEILDPSVGDRARWLVHSGT